jgi:hypothetical protein
MPFKPDPWDDNRETGIPCFQCKERSGLDCPGRKPNEATLCAICFEARMKRWRKEQADHLREYRKNR